MMLNPTKNQNNTTEHVIADTQYFSHSDFADFCLNLLVILYLPHYQN